MKNYTFLKSPWSCHFKYAKNFAKCFAYLNLSRAFQNFIIFHFLDNFFCKHFYFLTRFCEKKFNFCKFANFFADSKSRAQELSNDVSFVIFGDQTRELEEGWGSNWPPPSISWFSSTPAGIGLTFQECDLYKDVKGKLRSIKKFTSQSRTSEISTTGATQSQSRTSKINTTGATQSQSCTSKTNNKGATRSQRRTSKSSFFLMSHPSIIVLKRMYLI